jgi:ornithine cyclodeaminase
VSTLILTQAEVRGLLEMEACMEQVAESLRVLARGEAQNPLRWPMVLPDGARILGLMPGSLASPAALGLKVVTVFPGNAGTPWDSHQGIVVLFDAGNGLPLAILDGSEVTAIRTAAVSGVATRVLAREDARTLGLLGTGVQARTHLEAMRAARPGIQEVRVFSRSAEGRSAFARREAERHGIGVVAVDSARAAVEGADVVCTTTSAREPVLAGAWLAPGTHVNAVGACTPRARELDAEAVRRSRVVVDSRESAAHEAGDLLIPLELGELPGDPVEAELGEVLVGSAPGRRDDTEITLFESLGLAVEDLATAVHVLERARARGDVGTEVPLGGLRDA